MRNSGKSLEACKVNAFETQRRYAIRGGEYVTQTNNTAASFCLRGKEEKVEGVAAVPAAITLREYSRVSGIVLSLFAAVKATISPAMMTMVRL